MSECVCGVATNNFSPADLTHSNRSVILPSMNITHTSNPITNPTTEAPSSEDSSVKRVYDLIRTQPGREWRMADIEAALPDLGHRRIHAALMGIGRSTLYRSVHRVARGVYVYDEQRNKRVWVGSSKSKAARKAVKQPVKAPVEAKKPLSGPVNLRPSSAFLMEDAAGNFYLVTPIASK